MKTTNKKISKKEANKLLNSHGSEYPDTPHNRKMMRAAIDDLLIKLRAGARL